MTDPEGIKGDVAAMSEAADGFRPLFVKIVTILLEEGADSLEASQERFTEAAEVSPRSVPKAMDLARDGWEYAQNCAGYVDAARIVAGKLAVQDAYQAKYRELFGEEAPE